MERHVLVSHLEVIASLPWLCVRREPPTLADARRVLDRRHVGLGDCKRRVTELIATSRLATRPVATVLLLVSPPGMGKTSLAAAIAEATGRPLCRVALGGVTDPAELRGHRRTYVGAMPGRLIEAVRGAGCRDPVVLLDELDKVGASSAGPGASSGAGSALRSAVTAVLLEALDPEQAASFRDAYVASPFDLSRCLFVATANDAEGIPAPLLDRCEVVRLPSYTLSEKAGIARRAMLPSLLAAHGLAATAARLSPEGARAVVRGWTREAGVRGLRRVLAALCRRLATDAVEAAEAEAEEAEAAVPAVGAASCRPGRAAPASPGPLIHTLADAEALLGPAPFPLPASHPAAGPVPPGVATGLAWTRLGGERLDIEVVLLPDTGRPGVVVSGSAGRVLQESADAAAAWVRAHWRGVARRWLGDESAPCPLDTLAAHVHLPRAAISKDGPSAGVALVAALVSAACGRPLLPGVAATGEVTLTGRVLAVGGVRDKLLAAHALGLRTVVVPAANRAETSSLPAEVLAAVELIEVSSVDEALAALLVPLSRHASAGRLPAQPDTAWAARQSKL